MKIKQKNERLSNFYRSLPATRGDKWFRRSWPACAGNSLPPALQLQRCRRRRRRRRQRTPCPVPRRRAISSPFHAPRNPKKGAIIPEFDDVLSRSQNVCARVQRAGPNDGLECAWRAARWRGPRSRINTGDIFARHADHGIHIIFQLRASGLLVLGYVAPIRRHRYGDTSTATRDTSISRNSNMRYGEYI